VKYKIRIAVSVQISGGNTGPVIKIEVVKNVEFRCCNQFIFEIYPGF
jgi:hypothetical protein